MLAATNESYGNWGTLLKCHLEQSTTNSEERKKQSIINYTNTASQSNKKQKKTNKKTQNNKTNNKKRNNNQGQASSTHISVTPPDSQETKVTRQTETDKTQRHNQASNKALVTTAKEQHQTTTSNKMTMTIRILLKNIGGIDMMETGSIKLAAMRNFINEVEVDICAITECNVDWKKAPKHLYPREQTCYWWENSHWSIANNHNETNEAAYQPGGTALVVLNQLSHWAQRPGDDKVGLGQWCWARLQGKTINTVNCICLLPL